MVVVVVEGDWGGGVDGGWEAASLAARSAVSLGDACSPEPPVHMAAGIDPVIIARSSLYRLSRTEGAARRRRRPEPGGDTFRGCEQGLISDP